MKNFVRAYNYIICENYKEDKDEIIIIENIFQWNIIEEISDFLIEILNMRN